MLNDISDLELNTVLSAIKEQGETYRITYHSSSKSGKEWKSIILEKDGSLFAKQHATKKGNGLYFLCNQYAETKGVI